MDLDQNQDENKLSEENRIIGENESASAAETGGIISTDMSAEINADIGGTSEIGAISNEAPNVGSVSGSDDMMTRYKSDCVKLGFYLTVLLLLRVAAQGLSPVAGRLIGTVTHNADAVYALSLLYSALFLQIIPSFLGAIMLKYSLKNMVGGFHPPKNSKKAFANFPAIYGAGMTVNLITMAIIALVTQNGNINDSINSLGLSPPSLGSSLTLFVMLVVIAPVFEEFVFRGR